MNKATKDGMAAFMLASTRGHGAILKEMIKEGADVNIADTCMETALSGWFAAVHILPNEGNADANKAQFSLSFTSISSLFTIYSFFHVLYLIF